MSTLLRINNHGFSKFTPGFSKPFDPAHLRHDGADGGRSSGILLRCEPRVHAVRRDYPRVPRHRDGPPVRRPRRKACAPRRGIPFHAAQSPSSEGHGHPCENNTASHTFKYPHRGRTAFRVDGIICCLLTPVMFNHCESSYCKSSPSTRFISQKSRRRSTREAIIRKF
jgi:hypothetical protein